MLRIALACCLGLVTSSAWAFSDLNDIAEMAESRLAAQQQEASVEQALSGYLDQDDIAGAKAFVDRLAADGKIAEAERLALEDRIWRTKAEKTLDYARKIREAIKNSDLKTMREYNARLQRLNADTATADQGEPPAAADEPGPAAETPRPDAAQAAGEPTAAQETAAEVEAVTPERVTPIEPEPAAEADDATSDRADAAVEDETSPESVEPEVIADLMRRGEQAISTYNLSIAPPDRDSALGMVDQLRALGAEGEAAAKILGGKILEIYQALIERDIARGRLDKARTFVERMAEVAQRAGLPQAEIDVQRRRIDRLTTGRLEHDRLLAQSVSMRNRGQLVRPRNENALAAAARALKLGVDQPAASEALDDVIVRQQTRSKRLEKAGRLRDAARELESLANAVLAADIGKLALVADLRAEVAALYRRADRRDGDRQAAAEPPVETPAPPEEIDEDGNPFTFVNPF